MPLVLSRSGLLAKMSFVLALVFVPSISSSQVDRLISQKDQQFRPGSIKVGVNQPITIVNDDGSTVHHVYVESDTFNFDSGDQKPGTRTVIVFPVKGQFQVLCGIHPKMMLAVRVE